MVKMGFYSEPTNPKVAGYTGLYGGSCFEEYMNLSKELEESINWFFQHAGSNLDIEYNEDNWRRTNCLYHKLKNVGWRGILRAYTNDDKLAIPGFSLAGYDIGADSMYYSPLGDGLILKYNPSIDFFSDMTKEKYYVYKSNINDNWLFQSFDMATDFAKYCNHINKKHLHCIESEDGWRPFSIHLSS